MKKMIDAFFEDGFFEDGFFGNYFSFFSFFSFSLLILSLILFAISIENYFPAFAFFNTFYVYFLQRIREICIKLVNKIEWKKKENTTLFYQVVKRFNEKYYVIYCGFIIFFSILPHFSFLSNQNIVFLSFFILIVMWIQLGILYLQVKKEDKRVRKEQKERQIQEMIKMEKAMMERKACNTEDVSSLLYPY